jgi:transposase InsO family protein
MHVSDQGSHFKDKVIKEFNRILKINHHMTTAYSPWANATVEPVNKGIQKLLGFLSSEWQMEASQVTCFDEPSCTLMSFLPYSNSSISSLYGCDCNNVRNKDFSSFPSGFGVLVEMPVKDGVPHYFCATDVF